MWYLYFLLHVPVPGTGPVLLLWGRILDLISYLGKMKPFGDAYLASDNFTQLNASLSSIVIVCLSPEAS